MEGYACAAQGSAAAPQEEPEGHGERPGQRRRKHIRRGRGVHQGQQEMKYIKKSTTHTPYTNLYRTIKKTH